MTWSINRLWEVVSEAERRRKKGIELIQEGLHLILGNKVTVSLQILESGYCTIWYILLIETLHFWTATLNMMYCFIQGNWRKTRKTDSRDGAEWHCYWLSHWNATVWSRDRCTRWSFVGQVSFRAHTPIYDLFADHWISMSFFVYHFPYFFYRSR